MSMGAHISHTAVLSTGWFGAFALLCLAACLKKTEGMRTAETMSGQQAGEPQNEKESRTAAQKKLDSHLVLALKKSRSEPPFDKPTSLDPDLVIEPDGRVQVDLTATVSSALLEQITKAGGTVVSSFESAKAIRARIPLGQLEALAARADVIFISPAAQATTNQTEKSTNAPASGAGIRP